MAHCMGVKSVLCSLPCSGIWDVMSSKEVVSFIRQKISEQMKPAEVSVLFYSDGAWSFSPSLDL